MRICVLFLACLWAGGAAAAVPGYAELGKAADDRADICTRSHGEDVQVAIDACTWAIQSGLWKQGDVSWAYSNRGASYLALKRFDLAIADFNTAISLDPKDTASLTWRGIAYYSMSKFDLAIASYDQALAIAPDPDTFNDRGAAYLQSGQDARALEDYNKAVALDPKNMSYLTGRSVAYMDLGQYEQAIQDDSKILEADSQSPGGLLNRCAARAKWGQQLDLALADCSKAIQINAGNFKALVTRGMVYIRMGNYPLAIADEDTCLTVSPNWSDALYLRGIAEIKSNAVADGKADMAKAVAINSAIVDRYKMIPQ